MNIKILSYLFTILMAFSVTACGDFLLPYADIIAGKRPPDNSSNSGSGGDVDDGNNPGNPDDGNNPGNPDDGNNPGNPDDGNNPGNPDDGNNPGNPDDGNNPGNPDDGNNPGNPDDGNNPGNPDDGNNPGNPDDGNNPETPENAIIFKPFDSSVYFGRENLSTEEQKAYDLILKNILDYKNAEISSSGRLKIDLDGNGIKNLKSLDTLKKIMQFISYDDARLFHLDSIVPMPDPSGYGNVYKYNSSGGISYFYLRIKYGYESYAEYRKEMDAIEINVQKILSMIANKPSLTDAQKARILYEGFLTHVAYGRLNNGEASNIRGAFAIPAKDGRYTIICEGYAQGYLYLLQRVGIMGVYVAGTTKPNSDTAPDGRHAWNKVRIGDKWYNADPTWDDAMMPGDLSSKKDNFMKSDAEFYGPLGHLQEQVTGNPLSPSAYGKFDIKLPKSNESMPKSMYE